MAEPTPGSVKGNFYRELSKEATNYNLQNDFVSQMAMDHLRDVARKVGKINKERGNKTVDLRRK